jgi:hypothetical protein
LRLSNSPDNSRLQLMTFTAEPGAPSYDAVHILCPGRRRQSKGV